jgi:hypothetical protein
VDFGQELEHSPDGTAYLVRELSFLCLITPLCSYLYGGLYGGLHERAHIIRYFPRLPQVAHGATSPTSTEMWMLGDQVDLVALGVRVISNAPDYTLYGEAPMRQNKGGVRMTLAPTPAGLPGSFLCLITPLRSYLYGGLYGGLYERAHIIRYFPRLPQVYLARVAPTVAAIGDKTKCEFYAGGHGIT